MMIDKFDIVAENYVDDYKELAKEIYKAGLKRGRSKAKKMTWIPCSERLPEKWGDYFVTTKWKGVESGNVYTEINMAVYDERAKEWDCTDDVIAWMPLPEPYDPQESEE